MTYEYAWNLTCELQTRENAARAGMLAEWDECDAFIDEVDRAVNAGEIADNKGLDQ